eukprot:CAMPEP_0173123256 /NCGR_PEP_ID=MMETSP1102-20130122/54799_1 /TAXON_ID=49646 /ORGANISM="Geminigera sp., Strain Caron Lab Isolate" /LENGTH=39 /DNA_ID= /DNA_START= /DNA_END= /DNA_ORIENTATION=
MTMAISPTSASTLPFHFSTASNESRSTVEKAITHPCAPL